MPKLTEEVVRRIIDDFETKADNAKSKWFAGDTDAFPEMKAYEYAASELKRALKYG